jgi:hypothetical protein
MFVLNCNKLLLTVSFCCLSAAFFANAEKNQVISDKTIEMKCFVELYGGNEAVTFTNAPESHVKKLPEILVGSKITVQGAKQAKVIFKVKECAPLNDAFKNVKARIVDERTMR